MNNVSPLWNMFYKKTQQIEEDRYYDMVRRPNHIDIGWEKWISGRLDHYFMAIVEIRDKKPVESEGFDFEYWFDRIGQEFVSMEYTENREAFFTYGNAIWDLGNEMYNKFLTYVFVPTIVDTVKKHILKDIRYQDNPANRFVVDTTLSKKGDVYKVTITSNCDGWAECTKDIGYTLNPNLSLNGMTERNATIYVKNQAWDQSLPLQVKDY